MPKQDGSRAAEDLRLFLESLGSVGFLPRRRYTSSKWRCAACGLSTNDARRIARHVRRDGVPLYKAHLFVLKLGEVYAVLSQDAIAFKSGADTVAFPLGEFEKAASLFGAVFPALAAARLVEG